MYLYVFCEGPYESLDSPVLILSIESATDCGFLFVGAFCFFRKSLFLYGIQAKDRVALSSGLVVQGQRFQGRSDFPPMLLHLRTVNLKTLGSPGPCRCRLFALHTVLWPDPSSKYWFHHA